MTYPTAMLKPVDHLVVRDPITRQPLAADGELKPLDTYWCRRLADGDVTAAPLTDAPLTDAPKTPGKPTLKTV